jgi:hypothetical protein
MSYRLCWLFASKQLAQPVWHIPLLRAQWKTPYDGKSNCPKHVEFHSKNKFQKLVQLVGFIIRNLLRCTVTWTSWNFQNKCMRQKSALIELPPPLFGSRHQTVLCEMKLSQHGTDIHRWEQTSDGTSARRILGMRSYVARSKHLD